MVRHATPAKIAAIHLLALFFIFPSIRFHTSSVLPVPYFPAAATRSDTVCRALVCAYSISRSAQFVNTLAR